MDWFATRGILTLIPDTLAARAAVVGLAGPLALGRAVWICETLGLDVPPLTIWVLLLLLPAQPPSQALLSLQMMQLLYREQQFRG